MKGFFHSLAFETISLFSFLPLRRFPQFIKHRLYIFVKSVYEQEAILAYLNDNTDLGLFESCLLDEEKVSELTKHYDHRSRTWKRNELIERITGMHPRPEDFDRINGDLTLHEKKLTAINIVKTREKVVEYFGGRLQQSDPGRHRKLCRLYNALK